MIALNLRDWQEWYYKIVNTLGYNPVEDQRATDILSSLLDRKAVSVNKLQKVIKNKPVLICGAGPSLKEDLKKIIKIGVLGKFVLVSANGATTAIINIAKKIPNIVITDLDGRLEDILQTNKAGALLVVHGHGDNIKKLKNYVPKLINKIGTTQVDPRPNVHNFGGFTDGDRAVFLAIEMGAKLIVLAGMDFGQEVGKYSQKKSGSIRIKRMKLKIGKNLIEWLATKTSIPLYNFSSRGEEIKGFIKITSKDLLNII